MKLFTLNNLSCDIATAGNGYNIVLTDSDRVISIVLLYYKNDSIVVSFDRKFVHPSKDLIISKLLDNAKDYLTLLNNINDAVIVGKKVAKHTEYNSHTKARWCIASYLQDRSLIRAYEGVEDISSVVGYLPGEMSDIRLRLDVMLKARLANKYGNLITDILFSNL